MDPRYIFPEAKYIIGLAFRIPKGVQRGLEEGTQFYQYPSLAYGGKAVSNYLRNQVYSIMDHLQEVGCGIDSVTTTSPFIAKMINVKYKKIKTRASINMRIGTIKGMDYIKDIFDGYYLQREHNRDIEYIKDVKAYIGSQYYGNTLSLFEPNHTKSIGNHIIDNNKFPADFLKKTATCNRKCQSCDYCKTVLDRVLVKIH